MDDNLPRPTVSAQWLLPRLENPNIKLLDCSWHLPSSDRDPYSEFQEEHILGASFFDIDRISDQNSSLPHMLPNSQYFSECVTKLGISNQDKIIVYDNMGIFSCPRVWWTFRVFGHNNISVLDGGLPAWKKAGGRTSPANIIRSRGDFKATTNLELVASLKEVRATMNSAHSQIIDARGKGRYIGKDPEPRPGLRSGHIPGSYNIPYTSLLEPDSSTLLNKLELKKIFLQHRINIDNNIIATCGSGISASLIALALYVCGNKTTAVYDGSWTEWGGRKDTEVQI